METVINAEPRWYLTTKLIVYSVVVVVAAEDFLPCLLQHPCQTVHNCTQFRQYHNITLQLHHSPDKHTINTIYRNKGMAQSLTRNGR
jgi:hypothetical protein